MLVAADTSLLVGLFVPNDTWSAQATSLARALLQSNYSIVYFDCVAAEAVSALTRRLHERKLAHLISQTLARFRQELPAASITWILPDAQRFYDQVLLLVEQSNGVLNFHDALIALACRERHITHIASFDSDFDQVPWLKRIGSAHDAAGV